MSVRIHTRQHAQVVENLAFAPDPIWRIATGDASDIECRVLHGKSGALVLAC